MKFIVFFKKDLWEIIKTYRIYVIPAIFIFFGLLSPIVAYLLPDLLESMAGEVKVELPTPTWREAFQQYFDNLSQIGILAVIFSLMGVISDERKKGITQLVFYRPVSRITYVYAKFLAYSLLLMVSIGISYVACLYNTWILFPRVSIYYTLFAVFNFLIFTLFIGAITISASAVVSSNALAGGIGFGSYILLTILPSLHSFFAEYSPGILVGKRGEILAGSVELMDMVPALLITVILSILVIWSSGYIFSYQEL
ncbi:MAG: ABC transporter permease [Bacillota bacterium]